MRRLLSLLFLLALTACGGDSYIVLNVGGALTIPTETNALELVVRTPSDAVELRVIEVTNHQLDAGEEFPVDILLVPQADTPRELVVRVSALLDGLLVAQVQTRFEWREGVVNEQPEITLQRE